MSVLAVDPGATQSAAAQQTEQNEAAGGKAREDEVGLRMKRVNPQPSKNALADRESQIDVEAIIEQIWDDLEGAISRSDIRKTLTEVAPAYEGARVKTYVPIFLRKEVLRRLQGGLTHYQGAGEPRSVYAASGTTAASSRDELVELATRQPKPKPAPAQTS